MNSREIALADAVDERITREARDGTGHIIKWVKDAGG